MVSTSWILIGTYVDMSGADRQFLCLHFHKWFQLQWCMFLWAQLYIHSIMIDQDGGDMTNAGLAIQEIFLNNSRFCCQKQIFGYLLVQMMVVTYLEPSHYLNPSWVFVNLTLRNKLQWNPNQNTKLFIRENASENIICKMATILCREKLVKLKCNITWQSLVWCTTVMHSSAQHKTCIGKFPISKNILISE